MKISYRIVKNRSLPPGVALDIIDEYPGVIFTASLLRLSTHDHDTHRLTRHRIGKGGTWQLSARIHTGPGQVLPSGLLRVELGHAGGAHLTAVDGGVVIVAASEETVGLVQPAWSKQSTMYLLKQKILP